ncbi:MAG: hypothetical protein QOE90_52 [Thermoplasmata archaeon]|nr:hypothetical protein [Thermoplasmata archaeon]
MRRIWTIGYEGHDPESFTHVLRKAKVERVVDIRELPLSRKRGFSKAAMAAGLAAAGIGYSHLRALGTPRPLRHAYKAGGSFEAFRDGYLGHLEGVESAIGQLERMAQEERVAILCVEHDAAVCHRGVLAGVLKTRGWSVTDL